VSIAFTEGEDQRYAVPVMQVSREMAEMSDHGAPIAHLDDGALLVDAMQDPRGAGAVISSALRRRGRRTRHGELRGHPRRTRLASLADDPRDVQVLGVEQSNSSALIDGRLIAKLVRRLEPGLNPDVELPGHLTRAGFERVPAVAATLDIDLAGEHEPANLVIVHDAIDHESDLWVKVVDDLGLALDTGAAAGDGRGDETGLALAELLGRRTAELHRALVRTDVDTRRGGASSPMEPEAFTLLWQRSILQTLRNEVKQTQRELRRARRSGRLDEARLDQVARFDDCIDALTARFDRLRSTKLDAKRIRVHGDLHLGQVLWTGQDVVFIDFEGEPGAPIAQRSIKRSPLADVAGLVRSFDYASRMSVHTAIERGRLPETELAEAATWQRAWTTSVCDALLTSYDDVIDGSGLVPQEHADRRMLLDVYALTKALYEVRYELANRPDWVTWPLEAIIDMADDR
jgi:maltose alpha-D-glucosyltransferase/alpha-amylase